MKKALSLDEQIHFIKSLPIKIDDEQAARKYLLNISLCHLKAWWLSVPRDIPDRNFAELVKLYEWDYRLKQLISAALAPIELSVRAIWIQVMSDETKHYHALSYYSDAALYQNAGQLPELQQAMQKALQKDGAHLPYMQKYNATAMPPVWKMSEILSFGLLSRLIAALKSGNAIAQRYYLDNRFRKILHNLVKARNICAHHGILWNYTGEKLDLQKCAKAALLTNSLPEKGRPAAVKLYTIGCFCAYLLRIISGGHNYLEWKAAFKGHIDAAPAWAPLAAMGLPPGWQTQPLWQ